jgi:hypothetical protein
MGYGGTILIPRSPHGEDLLLLKIIKFRIGWTGHVARIGQIRSAYKILISKLQGKGPFQRPRCKLDDTVDKYGLNVRTGFNWLRIGPILFVRLVIYKESSEVGFEYGVMQLNSLNTA